MSERLLRGAPATGDGAPSWRFARFVRGTVGRILVRLFRVRVIGVENVPVGGVILAGNHVSYLDPALLWCVTPRPTHFVAKEELWDSGWLGWLLDRFWAFPVKRSSADRNMIQTATELLASGEIVGMFPEGSRKRGGDFETLGEAHGGVAFLALRADVPVVPVGFFGTDVALPVGAKFPRFVRVVIRIGVPVYPSEFEGDRRERVAAMTSRIMECIAELRDESRAG